MENITVILFSIFASMYIGASILLLKSISGFKSRLRIAYGVIIAGFIVQTLVHILETLGGYSSWWGAEWFNVTKATGYTIAPLLLYFGTRSFGRLLQIRLSSTSIVFTFGTGIVVSIAMAWVISIVSGNNALLLQLAFPLLIIWLLAMATITLLRAAHQTSHIYQLPIVWFTIPVGMQTIGAALFTVSMYVPMSTLTIAIPYIIGGFGLCIAAYQFYLLRHREIGELKATGKLENSIDVVVYAASLASNPHDIDPMLDRLRVVTAASASGRLSKEEQVTLRAIYLDIESYLITKEPIQKYNLQILRGLIARKLTESGTTMITFWPNLPPLT